ncbi:MAG: MFS transporter [Phenylobacterium zucineum]|nr:MAG: MFS transporter [Phenylobacterium zucineum]
MSISTTSEAPAPRFAAASLIAVIFINMLGFGIIVPLLPFYAKSFNAAPWQIGLIFGAYSVGAFFGEPFWGRLSDRYGRKPLLISTITGNCLCYLALAFAPNIWVAFFIRLVGGLAAGNGAVVQGYIADVTPRKGGRGRCPIRRSLECGSDYWSVRRRVFAHTGMGPAGFRIPLFIASGLAALCVIAIAIVIKESRVRDTAISHRPSRWSAAGEVARHPVIGRMMLLTFLVGFAFTGIESQFGLWSQARFDWGPRNIAVCFAFTGITAFFTQTLLTGRLSERYGEGAMLATGMAITALAAALQVFSLNGHMTIALMCLTAAGQSVAFPNVGAIISRTVDPHRQGQILGLNNAAGALARVVGPIFAGLMVPVVRDGPFILGALVVAPAILLALSATRRATAKPDPYANPGA